MLCEVQSDKASVEISSRFSGRIAALDYDEGAVAKVGTPLCQIHVSSSDEDHTASKGEPAPTVEFKPAVQAPELQTDANPVNEPHPVNVPSVCVNKSLATPAVRRLAQENSIDLGYVQGSGKDGRVMKEDVLRYLDQPRLVPTVPNQGDDIPLTGLRRAMFKAMTQSLTIPHFGFSEEVDVTALDGVRKQLSSSIPKR